MSAGQPRKVPRSVKKTLMIPGELCQQVEDRLLDGNEKLQLGAWQKLLTELLHEWLEREERQ